MKEKLIIKNFGPIKEVELELGRFTVLIGEQATGKSTVAKLLAVCRYFSYIVAYQPSVLQPLQNNFLEGLSDWGLTESIQRDSYIWYQSRHYTLTVQNEIINIRHENEETEEREIPLLPRLSNKSPEFQNLLDELEKIKPTDVDVLKVSEFFSWTIPTSFFQNDVSRVIDNPFYVPAERGLQSIFSLGKNPRLSNSLFQQLAEINEIARHFNNDTLIEPLDLIYKNDNGEGYVKKVGTDTFFALRNAAEGYRTTIPIVLITKYYSEIRKKTKTFIIEEPELSLFPTAQRKLIYYLSNYLAQFNNPIFLTTHSPYILTSLNLLIYAHKIGHQHTGEVEKLIEKKHWINPEDVSVYKMLPGGTCENIFDKESSLIKADEIDTASDLLNEQFDTLLNIEFESK